VMHASAPRNVRRYSARASSLVVRIELPVPAAAGILLEVVVGVAPEPLHMVVHEDEIAAALVHTRAFAPCEDADGVVGTVREPGAPVREQDGLRRAPDLRHGAGDAGEQRIAPGEVKVGIHLGAGPLGSRWVWKDDAVLGVVLARREVVGLKGSRSV